MSSDFILVSDNENGEPTEVTVESDGTIYLPSIATLFPGTTTLKYRNPHTNAYRLVKCIEGVLFPPAEGWLAAIYVTVKPEVVDKKRKQMDNEWIDNKRRIVNNEFSKNHPVGIMNIRHGRTGAKPPTEEPTSVNHVPFFTPSSLDATGIPPNEMKINQLLNRSGYNLERGPGERKYGAPPPNWSGDAPGDGCEVYVGNLPQNMYEDTLVPMFEQYGTIYEMRLKMDPSTGMGRGFCFVVFSQKQEAIMCVRQLKWYEIAPEQYLKVNIQINNSRLFIGNIPKEKEESELYEMFKSLVNNLTNIIMYSLPGSNQANRGFCFLDFVNHKAASDAKRKLQSSRVWNRELVVSWADTQEEPDEEKMKTVKTLYVKNLNGKVTDEALWQTFEQFGQLEKVKKVRDFAFVVFSERVHCLAALEAMNGEILEGSEMKITLARPADRNERNKVQKRREERKLMRGRGGLSNGGYRSPSFGEGQGIFYNENPCMGAGYYGAINSEYGGFNSFRGRGYPPRGSGLHRGHYGSEAFRSY